MCVCLVCVCVCLPTDEATAKSVKNNSPTDSEKQTAVPSKDNGFSLTKLSLCQILTTLVKPHLFRHRLLRSQWCVFSVCEPDNMNSLVTNKSHTGPGTRRRTSSNQDPFMFDTKFANESSQRCSRTGSCVAPCKPTTPYHPFWPQDHHSPLQMISQRVDHATNGPR